MMALWCGFRAGGFHYATVKNIPFVVISEGKGH